mgnify:CR=1 FL=1
MVCLGNICRSPMAEGIVRDRIDELDLEIELDSAGTGDWHVGEAPDKRARANMKQNGHDISDLRARQFTSEDFNAFDRIFVMDRSNYDNVVSLAANDDDKAKVDLFLNLASPGSDAEVPDPYFGGESGFQHVYELLTEATDRLMEEMANEKS